MFRISKRARRYDYVVALNYYHPHISGLTDIAKRVSEEMVTKGLTVCVVCQRHDKSLSKFETINGVDVVRARVLMRVSNGLISGVVPFFGLSICETSEITPSPFTDA